MFSEGNKLIVVGAALFVMFITFLVFSTPCKAEERVIVNDSRVRIVAVEACLGGKKFAIVYGKKDTTGYENPSIALQQIFRTSAHYNGLEPIPCSY